jgi:uncharacterized protein YbcV (DUF1398 family)
MARDLAFEKFYEDLLKLRISQKNYYFQAFLTLKE